VKSLLGGTEEVERGNLDVVVETTSGDEVALDLRIGLATGSLVVGNMGSEQAKSYTVMDDTVNIASRLKGANKVYGTRIFISEESHRLAAVSMETREVDLIRVVGKDEPLRIYELMGGKEEIDPANTELRDAFQEGLAAYRRQDWDQALGHFGRCAENRADDGPTAVYLDRVRALRADPPPGDWDGVWDMTRK
jgi:adenylate cyclase